MYGHYYIMSFNVVFFRPLLKLYLVWRKYKFIIIIIIITHTHHVPTILYPHTLCTHHPTHTHHVPAILPTNTILPFPIHYLD